MTDIADLQRHQVASTQLAVDAQIEERELKHPVLHLKSDPKCPNLLELERSLLPDDLAHIPRLTGSRVGIGSHDGLPSS